MSYYYFNGGVSSRDLYILSAAATGAAINRASSAEELKSYMLWGGGIMAAPVAWKMGKGIIWDFPKWTYQHRNNLIPDIKSAYHNAVQPTIFNSETRKAMKGHYREAINDTYYRNKIKEFTVPKFDVNTPQGAKQAEIYKDVNRLIEESKGLKGKELAAKVKEIEIAGTKAKIALNEAKAAGEITRNSAMGKAASWIKTKSGTRKLETKVLEGTMSGNKVVKTLSKGAKAGGSMALISAAIEVPNVVKTYKELGPEKGRKQLGKSAVKVAAETAGYVVGAKVGGIAGAKIGAAIGTCFGPIGTAVGGVVGTLVGVACGIFGSWLARKGAEAIVGKDELEIAQEEQTKQLAEAAKNNPELQAELAITAAENLQAGNVASEEDAQAIAQSVDKVVASLTNTTDAVPAESTETTPAVTTPGATTGTPAAPATTDNTTTFKPDAGMNALFALADGNVPTTGYTGNPFMMGNTMFNPFMNNYSNPFMMGGMFNPYMNNTMFFNPFMMNYGNLAA